MPGRKPCCQVVPPSVEVFQPMSELPPSLNRPTWEEVTMVLPYAKVSGSTSVACWLVELVYGSVLTLIGPPPTGLIVRPNVVVCVTDVPVPVTVIGYVPAGVVVLVVTVSADEAPPATEARLKFVAAPAGGPGPSQADR